MFLEVENSPEEQTAAGIESFWIKCDVLFSVSLSHQFRLVWVVAFQWGLKADLIPVADLVLK